MANEIRKLVQHYRIYMPCPECGEGIMYPEISQYMVNMLLGKDFEHTCDKCGHKETYECAYPKEEFVEVEV